MNRKVYAHIALICLFFIENYALFGQISKGGTPLSILAKISTPLPIVEAPQPDWVKIREEDKKGFANFRFAVPIAVNFTTKNAGIWTQLPNGGRLWQLKIHSKNALGLAVAFEDFELPEGAKLFMYSPDLKHVYGAYDASNNPESRRFLMGLTKGDETIVEYYEPKKAAKSADFKITQVFHAYNQSLLSPADFGGSLACEINVNCPQGANWQNPKRGAVRIRIVVQGGMGWCSGSLINNTRQDGTPYILSASHCSDSYIPDYSLWTVYFNYESPDCNNLSTEPVLQSLQGCVARANRKESDFLLLEMYQRVPTAFNAYFNGWNRDSNNLTASNVMIHHPAGDIKKISIDNDPPTVNNATITWRAADNTVLSVTPPRSHIQITPDLGTSEGGSSGAPIFDANGRIIAQNHGGSVVDCQVNYLLGGWLAKSWDGNGTAQTRLKDWLDPINTNALTVGGTNTPVPTTTTVAGKILFWKGTAPMGSVKVYIGNDSINTDASGAFSFSNVPLNTQVTVRVSKNDAYDNGLDAVDILLLRRHILSITDLNSNFKAFCGDVDNSNDLDVVDYLQIKRLILGINNSFSATTAWRFVTVRTSTDANFPLSVNDPSPLVVTFSGAVVNFNFYGYKKGDVDGSADLGQ